MEWDIYLLAGIRTMPTLFIECRAELQRRFSLEGRQPIIRELYPYGDHTRQVLHQLAGVYRDMTHLRLGRRPGGEAAAEQVRRLSPGRPVLFIAHSGGGAAAYRAAVQLIKEGAIADCRVVQIGSPKVPIERELRDKVIYVQAIEEGRQRLDSITGFGHWCGWSRSRSGLRYWDTMKHAPGHIVTVTLLGGHPYYFRGREPHVHPERGSNLAVTLNAIWDHMPLPI